MDDVLYILIGVAWVAYSIYSYNQKAKKRQADRQSLPQEEYDIPDSEEQSQPKKSAFEEMISEFQSYSRQESESLPFHSREKETFVTEPEIESVENVSSIEETTESNSSLSKEMLKQYLEKDHKKEMFVETDVAEYYNEIETEQKFDFDLRKAIIYSEILKRPEY